MSKGGRGVSDGWGGGGEGGRTQGVQVVAVDVATEGDGVGGTGEAVGGGCAAASTGSGDGLVPGLGRWWGVCGGGDGKDALSGVGVAVADLEDGGFAERAGGALLEPAQETEKVEIGVGAWEGAAGL